jgi:hypothetical protein
MIVALYSSVPQSGKSTIAEYIVDQYGFDRIKFADPMYDMIECLARYVFCSESDIIEYVYGNHKETPWPIVGMSTRQLLQSLGTEWGRQIVDPNIWLNIAIERIRRRGNDARIILDDNRFKNEFQWLYEGVDNALIRIVRPNIQYDGTHSSEGQLDNLLFDYTIVNDGTIDDLKRKADAIMDEVLL